LLPAGILLILGQETTQTATIFFDGTAGLEAHTVTTVYLLVTPLLIAVLTLPTWGVVITAAFNITVIVVAMTVYPESSAFHTLMRISPVPDLYIIIPIVTQIFCASLCSIVVSSLRESLVRADQAEKIQYLYQEQERLATTDAVTDLLNHRALLQGLQEVLNHSPNSCALLFVDLDHFKYINDCWGHTAGDAVLHEVAQRLQQVASKHQGIVGRYGGEEFAVVLPGIDLPQTLRVAQQMCQALALSAYVWQADERDERISIPITASIGVALFPLHATTENTLLAAADQAMYCAKQQGRNRVCLAGMGHVSVLP
jgi:diguanylate cyclase (GGDEF)-like protein